MRNCIDTTLKISWAYRDRLCSRLFITRRRSERVEELSNVVVEYNLNKDIWNFYGLVYIIYII